MDLDALPTHRAPNRPADRTATPTGGRRTRIAALLLTAIGFALVAAACAPPGSPGSGATGDMVQAVNQDRAANGLAPVVWDTQLHALAQQHADEIAASGSLWHSDLGGWLAAPWMAEWRSLGENLYVGPPGTNAWVAEDSWMASAPHRANILNPEFNHIGVGVKVDGAGRVWMVALFGAR